MITLTRMYYFINKLFKDMCCKQDKHQFAHNILDTGLLELCVCLCVKHHLIYKIFDHKSAVTFVSTCIIHHYKYRFNKAHVPNSKLTQ